ncbi:MAG TPA: beta-propeller domain-containing protein, partial [Acidimicrobiales bacterium]|nr:beta-propeller domain-containing protein [Acidimicrobiales bacterium]
MGTASEDRRRRGRAPVALGGAAGAVLVAGAVVAACSALPARQTAAHHRLPGSTTTTRPGAGVVPTGPAAAPTVSLVSYGDCSALLAQLKREALAEVGPYGLQAEGGPGAEGTPMRQAAPEGALAAPGGAASSGAASAGAASSSAASSSAAAQDAAAPFSTTNDQEAGVDEPDLAKTDGHLMVVLRHDPVGLQVVDVTTRSPHLDGFIGLSQLGSPTGLFLAGSEAVVIGGSGASPQVYPGAAGGPPAPVYPQPTSGTTATVVSLTDPQHPKVVRSFSLSGQEVDARQIDGRVLVVLQGSPQLPFTTPGDNSSAEQQRALQHNRAVVSSSTLQQWLPSTTTRGAPGRQLPACPTVLHPSVASGMGTVSVVSLD